jgi:hypothetical protein
MTVSTTSNRITYTGNGTSTVFAFPYKFIATSDIVVYVAGVLQTSGYTVGTPSDTGANITFSVAPASSASIVILANPSRIQSTSLPSTGPFPAKTVETMADKLTLLVQRLYDLTTRSLTLSDSDTSTASTVLPTPSANNLLAWNATGTGLQNVGAGTVASIVAYGTANADIFSGNGSQTAFTLTYNPASVYNLDVSVSGVAQRPNIDYTWTSGLTVTFVSAPPAGTNNVLIRYMQALSQGTGDSASVQYTPAGTGAVATTVQTKLRESVSVKDFGAAGDGVTDDTSKIQAAVNAVCGAQKTLYFPAGTYRISAAITFPNKSFVIQGEGPTSTVIKPLASATTINLFDFTGTNGPAKTVRSISFEGPSSGVYGSGTAIKAATNGLYLDNVWMRGILKGVEASGSFVNANQCVAEYCYVALSIPFTLDESIHVGWTFYKNETDISISGTQKSLIISDTTSIATKTDVLLLSGNGAVVKGLVVHDDGTGYTPKIVHIGGSFNQVSDVRVKDFGQYGVFFEGASATKNRVINLHIEGVPMGIFASAAPSNFVDNFTIKNSGNYGIRVDTAVGNRFSNFNIESCGYGISFTAAETTAFSDGIISASTVADWQSTGAATALIRVSNVQSNPPSVGTTTIHSVTTGYGGEASVSCEVTNGTSLDLTLPVTSGVGITGILTVTNSHTGVPTGYFTQTVYALMAKGTSYTATSLATRNGSSGGMAFTLSMPSNGVIRVTDNTALVNPVSISISFSGGYARY